MIKDKSLIVRLDIVHALSRIGGAKAVEILVKMRSDNNENIRSAVVNALYKLYKT